MRTREFKRKFPAFRAVSDARVRSVLKQARGEMKKDPLEWGSMFDEAARAFANRSQTGELGHVFTAQALLVEAGYVVNVEGGCQRTEKRLPWE